MKKTIIPGNLSASDLNDITVAFKDISLEKIFRMKFNDLGDLAKDFILMNLRKHFLKSDILLNEPLDVTTLYVLYSENEFKGFSNLGFHKIKK